MSSGLPSRWDTPAAYASALRLDSEPSKPAMTGCSSLSADDARAASGVGSGTSVLASGPASAATPSGSWDGVGAGCPCSGRPGDELDSAWSMIRVLAEDRFLDSHTVMIAPDERPYSYLKSTIDQRATIW